MSHTDTHLDLTTLPTHLRDVFATAVDAHLDDAGYADKIRAGRLPAIAYDEVIVPGAGPWQRGYSKADALGILAKAIHDASGHEWFVDAAWHVALAEDAAFQARYRDELAYA